MFRQVDAGFAATLYGRGATWGTRPWLRLIYVPACCTPVAQPMDAGIIAILKGHLRKLYGKWVVQLTVNQLARGVRHDARGRRVPSVVCSTSGWAYV